jgi:LuxR family transcriptional regulator, maltose regulon positive regulatory protein
MSRMDLLTGPSTTPHGEEEMAMQRPPSTTGAPGAPADDAAPRLSERQREMLGHLAVGRSTKQIAAAMSISINTVRGHGRSLLVKFGVDGRHEAVRRARELEML